MVDPLTPALSRKGRGGVLLRQEFAFVEGVLFGAEAAGDGDFAVLRQGGNVFGGERAQGVAQLVFAAAAAENVVFGVGYFKFIGVEKAVQ